MVLTPQMAISHLVMTIGVGISQKKNIKNFDDVQILWNDPYIILNYTTTSLPSAAACMMHDYHGGSPPNTKIDYRNPKVIMI